MKNSFCLFLFLSKDLQSSDQTKMIQTPIEAFFKECRVVGQICHEGMDESGILPKARYAMIVGHCLEQPGDLEGAVSPPVGPGHRLVGGPGGRSPRSSSKSAVHSTKNVKKTTFLVHFYLCAAYK